MNPVLPDRPVHEAFMREAIAMVRRHYTIIFSLLFRSCEIYHACS